jgi:hypothetical protein
MFGPRSKRERSLPSQSVQSNPPLLSPILQHEADSPSILTRCLQPRPLAIIVVGISMLVIVASFGVMAGARWLGHDAIDPPKHIRYLQDLFDVNREANLPTWWSSTQLLIAAGFAVLIAMRHRFERRPAWGWWMISAILVYLSIDEGAAVHDKWGIIADRLFGEFDMIYSWTVLALFVVVAVAVVLSPFVLKLPRRRTVVRLFACGGLFLFAVLGLETVSGLVRSVLGAEYAWSRERLLLTHIEETLELLAVSGLIITLQADLLDKPLLVSERGHGPNTQAV